MPPTRRKPSNPTARTQNTLSFGPNSNKITKPTAPTTSKKTTKAESAKLEKAVAAEIATPEPAPEDDVSEVQPGPEVLGSPSRGLPIRDQAGSKQAQGSEIEQKAAKIPETQIRKYWKSKEDERIAPRVHQQGLSLNEKVLRHFDLSSQYGVSLPRFLTSLAVVVDDVDKELIIGGDVALYRDFKNEEVEAG